MTEKALSTKTIIQRAPQVASRTIAGKVVLMKAPISSLNTLNSVGGFIWESIVAPKSIEELARLISEEFTVEQEEAMDDLVAFVKDLLQKDLAELQE